MTGGIKKDIIDHLTEKGNYDSKVDDIVIDILIENLEYAKRLQKEIDKGIIITIPNGNGIATTKENPAFGSYDKCLSNIFQCVVKLGISRKDRLTLKLMEEKEEDGFDEQFK